MIQPTTTLRRALGQQALLTNAVVFVVAVLGDFPNVYLNQAWGRGEYGIT